MFSVSVQKVCDAVDRKQTLTQFIIFLNSARTVLMCLYKEFPIINDVQTP